jgi:hypothetical protein
MFPVRPTPWTSVRSSVSTPARPAGRYGPAPRTGRRPVVIAALVTLAVVVLAWILWVVVESRSPVQWTDVGFDIVSDQQVDVTYDVHKDPDATVTCTLRALDRAKGTVGTADVVVGPGASGAVRRTDTVRTSALAVTGFVHECIVSGRSGRS